MSDTVKSRYVFQFVNDIFIKMSTLSQIILKLVGKVNLCHSAATPAVAGSHGSPGETGTRRAHWRPLLLSTS